MIPGIVYIPLHTLFSKIGAGGNRHQIKYYLTDPVFLGTGNLPPIPLEIKALTGPFNRRYIITPFHPENGYPLEEADYDPNERWRKVMEILTIEGDRTTDPPFADPVCLKVEAADWSLAQHAKYSS